MKRLAPLIGTLAAVLLFAGCASDWDMHHHDRNDRHDRDDTHQRDDTHHFSAAPIGFQTIHGLRSGPVSALS